MKWFRRSKTSQVNPWSRNKHEKDLKFTREWMIGSNGEHIPLLGYRIDVLSFLFSF